MADISRTLADLPVIEAGSSFKNLVGNGTALVKTGAGTLTGLLINNNSTGGTIALYDGTSAAGTLIGTFTVGSPSGGLLSTSGMPGPAALAGLGVQFNTGLYAVTAGSTANNFTVTYQ